MSDNHTSNNVMVVGECACRVTESYLVLHIGNIRMNQWNVARNGLGMQKTIRNDVSHIKFEQTI